MTGDRQGTVLVSWGARPLAVDTGGWSAQILDAGGGGPWLQDPQRAVREALDSPDGLPGLEQWLDGANRVLVVVPHEDHPMARSDLLRFVVRSVQDCLREGTRLEVLAAAAQVAPRLVDGTGRNEGGPPGEEWTGYDPMDPPAMKPLGEVGRGGARSVAEGLLGEVVRAMGGQRPSTARAGASAAASRRRSVSVCAKLLQADRIIAIGFVFPHPILGFSGACTNLVPGLADRDTLRAVEQLSVHPVCGAGRVEGNTARDMAMDGVAMLGDRVLCVDILASAEDRVSAVAAGLPARVQQVLAPLAREAFGVRCSPSASVVAASPALDLESLLVSGAVALSATRTTGTLLLVGQCPEGAREGPRIARILEHVLWPRLGRGQLLVHTPLEPQQVIRCGLRPVRSVRMALRVMRERASGDDRLTVFPDCSRLLPQIS